MKSETWFGKLMYELCVMVVDRIDHSIVNETFPFSFVFSFTFAIVFSPGPLFYDSLHFKLLFTVFVK